MKIDVRSSSQPACRSHESRNPALSLAALILLMLAFACGTNTGTLTVVNPTIETVNVKIGGKTVTIAPEQHVIQKGLKPGLHRIKLGANTEIDVEIRKRRTTLIDIGGDNCFIVADYTDQYGESGTGRAKVIEKFVNEKTFTTSNRITSELGEKLPKGTKGHRKITRLHRVDCSWIDNNQAIIDAIANLP